MVTRYEITPAGFRGADLLLRHGMRVIASIRGGQEPKMSVIDGSAFTIQDSFRGLLLVNSGGAQIAVFSGGRSLRIKDREFTIEKDPYCPDWFLLQGIAGTFARFGKDFVDIEIPILDPIYLLFLAWCIREKNSQSSWASWLES